VTAGVAFLGSDDGAARCLAVLAERVEVGLVVTPPPRRRGRRGDPVPTPVAATASELGLPVLATGNINEAASVARLSAAHPRLLVVVAFGQILRREVRDVPALGSLNLHFSLLPRWRGAAPVQHALLAGDTITGVSVQRLVARLDAGDVLAQQREAIAATDDTPTLRARLVELGAPLLAEISARVLADAAPAATAQDESQVTQASLIGAAAGDLDPCRETAVELERRIRALDEWPGCHAVFERPKAVAQSVLVRAAQAEEGCGAPGAVVGADAAGVLVACRSGVLRITSLQKPGKRALGPRDFLNGCSLSDGSRLVAPVRA